MPFVAAFLALVAFASDRPSAAALRSADGSSPAAAVAPAGSPPGTMSSTNPAVFEAYLQQFPNGPDPADETCAGKPEGATCWMQVHGRPGCYVWNRGLEMGATVTWTGECAGGVAQGAGTLIWTWGGIQRTDAGRVVDGRPHGRWVLRYPNQESSPHGWDVLEGPYVNGMAHGHWLLRATTSGRTSEGPLVDGQQTGHWVTRFADGNIMEGPYVNGVEHGRWIWRRCRRNALRGRRRARIQVSQARRRRCALTLGLTIPVSVGVNLLPEHSACIRERADPRDVGPRSRREP